MMGLLSTIGSVFVALLTGVYLVHVWDCMCRRGTVVAIMFVCFVLVVLSGCASTPAPYLDIGVGVKIPASTNRYVMETGRNPTGHIALGLEFDHGITLEYNHWSHVRDGVPFNDRYELWKDELILTKRFGGRK